MVFHKMPKSNWYFTQLLAKWRRLTQPQNVMEWLYLEDEDKIVMIMMKMMLITMVISVTMLVVAGHQVPRWILVS